MKSLVVALSAGLLVSCSFRRKKYENPITKDTQQPDKVLFDKAINDIEKGRYDVARLTLQTLISTYDTSEYLAKSKLAIADSWFREGGSHGLAQAEAEYKDFILFYPTLEEAAEAQEKVCMIHYRQMEKPDRDQTHALRAEDECRQVLTQFPNSKFAPRAEQLLRNIQEVIAEGEFRAASFYHTKGSYPAAANRMENITQHYPLFSKADEALWLSGDSYGRMGPRFREKAGDAYTRIVRDYPLSERVEEAKKKLTQMEMPVPEPDAVALNRMKYEKENFRKPGMLSSSLGIFRKSPDTYMAAKSGAPALTPMRPGVPATVPTPEAVAAAQAAAAGTAGSDVTATVGGDTSALDTQPDARRAGQFAGGQNAAGENGNGAAAVAQPAPQPENGRNTGKKNRKQDKQGKNDKKKEKAAPAAKQ